MKNILEKIPEKSAVLIIGSPLSDKENLISKIISESLNKKNPVIFVTTDHFPKDIESSLKKNKISFKKHEDTGNLKFIDCYTAQAKNILSSNNIITRISGPLALNEISVALSEVESGFVEPCNTLRI